MKAENLLGQKFGRLTVVERAGNKVSSSGFSRPYWKCLCECGNEVVAAASNLKRGNVKSCGCLQNEYQHSHKVVQYKHGMSNTRLFRVWWGMHQRCKNPKVAYYKNYGGRGISVCDEWQEFGPFYEWAMANGFIESKSGKECSIDRIDSDGNYEPSNCRWVTNREQQKNKKTTKLYCFDGKSQLISEWAKEFGVTESMIRNQIWRGKTPSEVLSRYKNRGCVALGR